MSNDTYRIEVYYGSQHPSHYPYNTDTAATEREAHRRAAQMLGHTTLRGASTWSRYQGGQVYQFGPRTENNGYDFVVIIAPGDEDEQDYDETRDQYDCPA